MPFASRADVFGLSVIPTSWTLWGPPEITPTDSGWDTIRAQYVKDFRTSTPSAANLRPFDIGDAIESLNFWVSGSQPNQLGGNIWVVTVTGKGIAASRPVKVSGRSTAEQQQGDNISGPGFTNKRAVVLESAPTVCIEYVQVGGSPPTGDVGLAGTPAVAPAVRATVWDSLDDPLYHYPSGWVFMDIDWEQGPGNHAILIKEAWAYIFEQSI